MATAPLVVFGEHASEAARAACPWRPAVYDVAFADNATVVSGGMDKEARVWDARTGAERRFEDDRYVGLEWPGVMNRALNPIQAVAVARRRGVVAIEVECRIQPGLLFSQIASQGNLHDMFCSCLDISPDGRCLALGRNDGRALTWALETPRAAYARLLLLRAATKEGAKPRVTATDAASTGHHALFRLVDEGKADVAAYALKFIL